MSENTEKFKPGDKVRVIPSKINNFKVAMQPVLKRDGIVFRYTFPYREYVIVEFIPKTKRGHPEKHQIKECYLELIP